MNFSKISLLFFMLFGMIMQTNAQLLNLGNAPKYDAHYTDFTAILYNGKPLVKDNTPDGPLRCEPRMRGKLTVSTIDRSGKEALPVSPIGFKVAIKNGRTGTIWMYSEETLYEVKLEDLLEKCEWGDKLIIMTVDRKYQLPRNELVLIDNC